MSAVTICNSYLSIAVMKGNLVTKAAILLCSLLFFFCAGTPKYLSNSNWQKNGITSLETIRVNGLKHELLIRGTDTLNSLVVFIHGLGIPSMCFAHFEYAQSGAALETLMTVVHYDQRGFGKTYIHGKRRSKYLTVNQFVNDAEVIVDSLRHRFHKEKVYLVCESWGSVIGLNLVKKHPEWFNSIFTMGQNDNVSEYLKDVHEWCMQNAEKESNKKALTSLQQHGTPTLKMSRRQAFKSYMNTAEWMYYYEEKKYGPDSGQSMFFKALWEAPEYNFYDFFHSITAYIKSQKRMIKELLKVNVEKDVPSIKIPIYIIMGERDFWLPQAKRYFNRLEAPQKKIFIIKDAGHIVRGDKPEEVEKILFSVIGNDKIERAIN